MYVLLSVHPTLGTQGIPAQRYNERTLRSAAGRCSKTTRAESYYPYIATRKKRYHECLQECSSKPVRNLVRYTSRLRDCDDALKRSLSCTHQPDLTEEAVAPDVQERDRPLPAKARQPPETALRHLRRDHQRKIGEERRICEAGRCDAQGQHHKTIGGNPKNRRKSGGIRVISHIHPHREPTTDSLLLLPSRVDSWYLSSNVQLRQQVKIRLAIAITVEIVI